MASEIISQLVNLVKIPAGCTIEVAELGQSSSSALLVQHAECNTLRRCSNSREGAFPASTSVIVAVDSGTPRS